MDENSAYCKRSGHCFFVVSERIKCADASYMLTPALHQSYFAYQPSGPLLTVMVTSAPLGMV